MYITVINRQKPRLSTRQFRLFFIPYRYFPAFLKLLHNANHLNIKIYSKSSYSFQAPNVKQQMQRFFKISKVLSL